MKYFDAHTHVNFAAFSEDREAAIMRAHEADVAMNVVGTQAYTSRFAVEVAEKHEHVYATIGLHPVHTSRSYHDEKELGPSFATASQKATEGKEGGGGFTSRGEVFNAAAYEKLAASPKVVAIGECGLDYYRLEEHTKKTQEEAFIQQIELANSVGKPLMLHIRASQGTEDAYDDALAILRAHAKVKGDVHFFAGDWETAKKFLDFGFTLSFTGVITFTNDYNDVIKNAPLDMLLSETDAPYVAPIPHRGRRNEPAYVVEVVRAIARIRGEEFDEVSGQLIQNARRMFKI